MILAGRQAQGAPADPRVAGPLGQGAPAVSGRRTRPTGQLQHHTHILPFFLSDSLRIIRIYFDAGELESSLWVGMSRGHFLSEDDDRAKGLRQIHGKTYAEHRQNIGRTKAEHRHGSRSLAVHGSRSLKDAG